jgi:hypothetical protein
MGRFHNLFDLHWRKSRDVGTSDQAPAPEPSSNDAPRGRHAPHASVGTAPDRLDEIRDYVRGASNYIQWLQGLTENERSNVAQVNEIKRELKSAHRSLEKLYAEKCPGLGEDIQALVRDATGHAWRSYRGVVKLEETLRGAKNGEADAIRRNKNIDSHKRRTRSTGNNAEQRAYAPNGVLGARGGSQTPPGMRTQYIESDEDEETFMMSGALPRNDGPSQGAVQRAGRAGALNVLRDLPNVLAHGAPSEARRSRSFQETNPEQIPQPRDEVNKRIQEEGSNQEPTLRDPDRMRRGSCNGFTITEMTMKGVDDPRFVLPYLYYMKLHELRYLKEWLGNEGHVKGSGTISRTEKCLLCIQLLQTGCRYEALAVIHSRSPRQVRDACLEVMHGLLQWHLNTVDEDQIGEQAKYLGLWGIWSRYVASDGRAGLYFDIDWPHLAKVLLALNMYMGRWRMQGKFAMDGPAFLWGKFFVPQGNDQIPDSIGREDRRAIDVQEDDSSIVTNPFENEAWRDMAAANAG